MFNEPKVGNNNMKDEIEKLREKINKIEIQIEELVKNKWNDYNFEHKIGYWDCKESPIEICVYNSSIRSLFILFSTA